MNCSASRRPSSVSTVLGKTSRRRLQRLETDLDDARVSLFAIALAIAYTRIKKRFGS